MRRPERGVPALGLIRTHLGYPFNRSQGRSLGQPIPLAPGRALFRVLEVGSPANRCATKTSAQSESAASTPAGAWAPAEPRVSFSGPPAASTALGNAERFSVDGAAATGRQWQGVSPRR